MIAYTNNGYGDGFTPPTSGGTFTGTDRFGNPIYAAAGGHSPASATTTQSATVPLLTRTQAVTSPVSSPMVVPQVQATLVPAASVPAGQEFSVVSTQPAGTVQSGSNLYAVAPSSTPNGTMYTAPSGSGAVVDTSAGDVRLIDAMLKMFGGSQSVPQNLAPQLYAPADTGSSSTPAAAPSSKAPLVLAVLAVAVVAYVVWRRSHRA